MLIVLVSSSEHLLLHSLGSQGIPGFYNHLNHVCATTIGKYCIMVLNWKSGPQSHAVEWTDNHRNIISDHRWYWNKQFLHLRNPAQGGGLIHDHTHNRRPALYQHSVSTIFQWSPPKNRWRLTRCYFSRGWVVASEVSSLELRASTQSLAILVNSTIGFAISFATPYILVSNLSYLYIRTSCLLIPLKESRSRELRAQDWIRLCWHDFYRPHF